jgi:hypothetical protein
MNDFGIIYAPWTFNFNIDLIFGIWNYNDELQIKFSFWSHWIILAKLPRELKKGETFASLLNIHGGDIRVVPTHLVFLLRYIMTI